MEAAPSPPDKSTRRSSRLACDGRNHPAVSPVVTAAAAGSPASFPSDSSEGEPSPLPSDEDKSFSFLGGVVDASSVAETAATATAQVVEVAIESLSTKPRLLGFEDLPTLSELQEPVTIPKRLAGAPKKALDKIEESIERHEAARSAVEMLESALGELQVEAKGHIDTLYKEASALHKALKKEKALCASHQIKAASLRTLLTTANSKIRSLKSKMDTANRKIITLQAQLKEAKVAQKSKQPGGRSRSLEPTQLKSPNTIQREKVQIRVEEFERKEAVKLANKEKERKRSIAAKNERLQGITGGLLNLSSSGAFLKVGKQSNKKSRKSKKPSRSRSSSRHSKKLYLSSSSSSSSSSSCDSSSKPSSSSSSSSSCSSRRHRKKSGRYWREIERASRKESRKSHEETRKQRKEAKKKRKEKPHTWKPRRKEKENRRASFKTTGEEDDDQEEVLLPKFPEKQDSPRTRKTRADFSIGSNNLDDVENEEKMEE